MGAILICAIGNRDVIVSDQDRLPAELRGEQAGARLRGAYLLEHYGEFQNTIQLPILSKALNYLRRRHQQLEKIILVVSDQPDGTPDSYRNKDTIEFGNIIKEYLPQHPEWSQMVTKRNIWIKPVKANPADFDEMHSFFQQELVRVKDALGEDHSYYLALSGGTPAMAAMLLFVGSDVFGKTYIPLYISDTRETPLPLEASRQIYQQSMRTSVSTAIKSYSYTTAITLLRSNMDDSVAIVDSHTAQQLIAGLLTYAHQRLAFDFEAAYATLANLVGLTRYPYRAQIEQLLDEMVTLSDEWKLREVYFGADIKYRMGEYADFLARVWRFHEGILRFLAQSLGAHFTDQSGKKLDVTWIRSVAGLQEWFANYVLPEGGTGILYEDRDVSRVTLVALVEFLARQQGAEARVAPVSQIERLASLRNQSFIAHNFKGVSKLLLAQTFTGDPQAGAEMADDIVPAVASIYESAVGKPVGPNPFDGVNTILEALLNEAA